MEEPQVPEIVFLAGRTYSRDETWRYSDDGRLLEVEHGPWVDVTTPRLPLTQGEAFLRLPLKLQLEIDAMIHGSCFVKLTDNGPVRIDPREVQGQ